MSYRYAALIVLILALPCRAADEPKPNTLTPKEIAEGWISLFDGETTFGWDDGGKPEARENVLIHGGDEKVVAGTTTEFLFYELAFEYRIEGPMKEGALVELLPSSQIRGGIPLPSRISWASAILKVKNGEISGSTKQIGGPPLTDDRHLFKLYPSPKPFNSTQRIAFSIPKGTKLSLRNFKLKPLDMKPLFNGKDLTDWKKLEPDPKRAKSQFTVTKDGCLSITNGPGDLQTTSEWSDFVLQLDCRTNGDNLNSGVFLRCIPGQYQNGYEAQIQNQAAKQPKKYSIDEYDPKTRQLLSKKEVENWSQDFGTGSIYRRVPARRAVAKDREWFTMTVIARGRHFATWVNGIQVVDWTDNRPENENARNGCRLKKGPISLQGHDPTTDLSFRNIRIADLSEKD
ncbi:MAG TPA: DUF1080 domain-containing protein [Gemmataceae bacterium]|jgi:hypothetical protein